MLTIVEENARDSETTMTADELALQVWTLIFEHGFQDDILKPLLLEYARDRDRERTHAIEAAAGKAAVDRVVVSFERIKKGEELSPRQKRAKEYLYRTMRLGDGRQVVIATATRRDWLQWRRMLSAQEKGVRATGEMADRVIELFDRYHAKQTQDIPLNELADAVWEPMAGASADLA